MQEKTCEGFCGLVQEFPQFLSVQRAVCHIDAQENSHKHKTGGKKKLTGGHLL